MGVTVNHWLAEFDSLMRSQVSFVVCKPWGKREPRVTMSIEGNSRQSLCDIANSADCNSNIVGDQ